jgi:hypothetical protein
VTSKKIGEGGIAAMYTSLRAAATVTRPVRASSFDQMRRFLRHLPLLALAACATPLPVGHSRMLATSGIGCEQAVYGEQARTVAIYTRVVADRVCVLDAAGQCHARVSAEVRLPQTRNAPPGDALRQELGRRGILARIARPRGPKMYASLGSVHRDDGLLMLELGDIVMSDEGKVAHVMVRASRMEETSDWPGPGGQLVRLVRTLDVADEGLSRRIASPVRACWRLDRATSSALAD